MKTKCSKLRLPEAKISCRHIQVLLLHCIFFCLYGVRAMLSIAIVAMTTPDLSISITTFDWNSSTQNLILSSFALGFILMQIPGGELGSCYGTRMFFCCATGICGFVTILIPVAALYGGWQAVVLIRIVTGVVQGVIPACAHILLSKWIPVDERARAGSCIYAGGALGTVVALLSSGAISKSVLGWSSCFYIWGGISILCAILYYFKGKPSPLAHPTISIIEKEYIASSLGVTDTVEILKTPWTAILTSTPFWAVVMAQSADSWGYWMLYTKTSTYIADILNYDIFENGLVTALPYLASCLFSFPISIMCDKMVKGGRATRKTMRKVANSIGQFIPAFMLIGFSFITSEHRIVAVVILIITIGINSGIYSGYLINHLDLSPNFSGILIGFTNVAGDIFGIIAILICGVIVPDTTDIYQWRMMFFLTAGVYILGGILFVMFGDATVQPWNEPKANEKVCDDIPMSPITTAASDITIICPSPPKSSVF